MNRFLPKTYQKNIYTIDYKNLYNKGIKCILFDLDNTLVEVNQKNADEKLKNHIKELKEMGFNIIIFSNGLKYRVEKIKNDLQTQAISFARKPYKANFIKIIKKYGYKENEIAIIGDQLLTDIQGGNKVGIITILVDPISNNDGIFTRINRKFERKIMRKLSQNNLFEKGKYYE